MSILCYIIAAYGLTNLLVYGSGPYNILTYFRQIMNSIASTFGDMLSCMMCTSTNVGIIISIIDIIILKNVDITPFNILIGDISLWYIIIPLDACLTSGAVWIIHTIQEFFESKNNINTDGTE